jgi:hypothetical protein
LRRDRHILRVAWRLRNGAENRRGSQNIFTVDETDTVAPDGKTYSGSLRFQTLRSSDCANSANGYVCTGTPTAEVTGTTYGVHIAVE